VFAENLNDLATVVVLTTPYLGAELCLLLENDLNLKLWVALKVCDPKSRPGELPREQSALIIWTKYRQSLIHTKTRIAYSYCPFCDKTTKDYGGKKHTYHEYGTLMSDVWRDICVDPSGHPTKVITRLRDLFGLQPFDMLCVADLREVVDLKSIRRKTRTKWNESRGESSELTSGRTLFCGDCLDVLRAVPSNSMDFCFADPPYNLKKKYDEWHDSLEIRSYFEWCDAWLFELGRVLKPGRTLAVLNIPAWAIRHFAYLKTILNFQYWIAWEGLGLPVRMVMPAHYTVLCFSKGRARRHSAIYRSPPAHFVQNDLLSIRESYCLRATCMEARRLQGSDQTPITDIWWDIHRLKHNCRRVDHPCQLPPALMRRLVALFTEPGECVLDPFNGVGTTTLAAESLGRCFVGIERSEYYHSIAQKRHEELRNGEDPFRRTDAIPKAKNSPVPRLKKQVYVVPKKVLQLEVREIARRIGRMPTRDDVVELSQYPISYFDDYFISWGEVCAAARTTGMSEIRKTKKGSTNRNQLTLF